MSEHRAAALGEEGEQTQPQPAAPRRSASLRGEAAAAAAAASSEGAEEKTPPSATPTAATTAVGSAAETHQSATSARGTAAAASAACSLRRLAAVELQLVMQHCDLPTLLALARCSRFTLAAASHPFAWRYASLYFDFNSAGADADLCTRLRSSRLLSHCGVSLRWADPDYGWSIDSFRRSRPITEAELTAIESVPRLVTLDTGARRNVSHVDLQRLLSHPALGGLTALHPGYGRMNGDCTALLPLHQPRLCTLSLGSHGNVDADRALLAPLAQLPSLADLTLDRFSDLDADAAAAIAGCSSLCRLRVSGSSLSTIVSMTSTLTQLESLSLHGVHGPNSEAWTRMFSCLHALRSLSLHECASAPANSDDVLLGLAATLAANALRSLTALRVDTLAMGNADGSLLPLLAAHCPQLRQLHVHDCYNTHREDSVAGLADLPLLTGLSDLRLQLGWHEDQSPLAVGCFAALRRLHLNGVKGDVLHAALCSAPMQRLESLTLGFVSNRSENDEVRRAGWCLCIANLHSLRTLNLHECNQTGLLLTAIQSTRPPYASLRRIRLLNFHSIRVVAARLLLAALLAQLPSLTVELLTAPPRLGLANPEWPALRAEWKELARRHPGRAVITEIKWHELRDPFDSWER